MKLLALLSALLFSGPLTDKLHYAPGDTVNLTTPNACTLRAEIDNDSVVQKSFTASGFGGFQLTDTVTQVTSVFTVSSNPLDTAVGGQAGSTGFAGGTKWGTLAAQLIASNQTFVELPFWSPADCMVLDWSTQPGGQGFSGQTCYPENDANLIAEIQECHAKGITVAAYTNCYPAGPPGVAWAKANPTLCKRDSFGNIAFSIDPSRIANWPTSPPVWCYAYPDWSQRAAVNKAIAAIQVAVKRYDFDVVRWDGFYDVPGNVTANVDNAVAVRQGLDGLAIVGNNFGTLDETDAKAAVLCSDGGLYLQESGNQGWQVGLDANSIGANWFTTGNGETSYAFPSHPMYGQYLTPAINQWLLRWSGFLWDRTAYTVTTSPTVGSYVRTRRGSDGLRYDTLFLTAPGAYALPTAAYVVTTPEATSYGTEIATVKSYGIAIWRTDDRLPPGTITVTCDRSTTGYNPPLGPDGRQWRPDLSTTTDKRGPIYPFLGFASVAPVPAGTYIPVFRLWYEPSAKGSAGVHMRIENNGTGKDISTLTIGLGGTEPILAGWGYQDYKLPPITVGGDLQASVYPIVASFGALHLDSVSLVPVTP